MVDAELQNAINDVLVRYATGIDSKDWDLFRSCFAEECVLDYGAIGTWTSPDEITEFMRASHANSPHTMHRITNIVVTSTGADTTTARSYVDALILLDATTAAHPAGYYDDELVRTDQEWKITHRRFTLVLMQIANGVPT